MVRKRVVSISTALALAKTVILWMNCAPVTVPAIELKVYALVAPRLREQDVSKRNAWPATEFCILLTVGMSVMARVLAI